MWKFFILRERTPQLFHLQAAQAFGGNWFSEKRRSQLHHGGQVGFCGLTNSDGKKGRIVASNGGQQEFVESERPGTHKPTREAL
jgi:hypothetical protein